MWLLRCLAVLSFLLLLSGPALGTYNFYVELQSFSNPTNRDFDGGCCDIPSCGTCDNYFIFCLRQAGYDQNSNICPYGTFSTAGNVRSGSTLQFDSEDLAPGVSNPVLFQGDAWPLGFQLKIRVMDEDSDAEDLIDYFIIEESSFLPTNEYTEYTNYYGHHSSSVTIRLRLKLRCRGNWHGYDCNLKCVDENTDTAHLECALDGTHMCMEGWTDLSTQCTVPICKEGCHPTGGTCNQPGECNCESGWSGDLCDVCASKEGCENGYCTSPNDCTCNEGYTGPLCDILEDPCNYHSPCVHGNCTNEEGGTYSCSCAAGYTGSECETEIDECLTFNPCLNGATCLDLVNGFTCSCAVGWNGDTCGDDIDECAEVSACKDDDQNCTVGCLNGGTCVDGVGEISCQCPPEYRGDRCEEPPPPERCGELVCKEDEICVVVGDGSGKDGHLCAPCDNGPAGCDKEVAAQSDDKASDNTPVIIGVSVGGGILLLLVLLFLLLIYCCCFRSCWLLLCPCLGRDKIEENGRDTLTSPHSRVSHNTMFVGPNTLLASGGKTSSLTSNGGLQNPMYAAPGGVKPTTPSSSTANGSSYDQLRSNPNAHKEDMDLEKGDLVLENSQKDNPHYEPLGPHLLPTTTPQYQTLMETSLGETDEAGSKGPYAFLYNVPSMTNCQAPQVPPRPPQLMPPTGGRERPENPYIITPVQTSGDSNSMATTSPTISEKSDLAKELDKEDLSEL